MAKLADSESQYPHLYHQAEKIEQTRMSKDLLYRVIMDPDNFEQISLKKDLLEELAKSIMEKGIFQPLLIRKAKDTSRYEIVAGERRWRAAQLAKKHEIPCIILDINDKEASEISLIENLQRRDLTSIEEAKGYTLLIKDHNYTHE